MAIGAFFFVRCLNGNSWAAIACAFALLFGRTWAKQHGLLSDIYLTVVVLLFCFMLTYWLSTVHLRYAIVSGLLAGIAIGVKPSGLLLVVVPLILLPIIVRVVKKENQYIIRNLTAYGLFVCVAISPLAIHNYREAGTLLWPDLQRVSSVASLRVIGKNLELTNPSPKPLNLST